MSVPSSILPPWGRSETEAWIGTARPVRLNASRAPKIDALTSRMSCAVSMMSRSAPPSMRPCACSAKTSSSSRNVMLPERRVVGGGEVAGGPDRAGDEALLADRLAGDLGRAPVDLERVLGQAPLLELEAAGLEGVGLDDLGARLDHRRVDALDDVGALEDQRLVALARQAAVVLSGEVELLQGGAHAAVEDDDAAADCLEIVAHAAANANSDRANLDNLVAMLRRPRTSHADGGVTPPKDDVTPKRDRGWGLGRAPRVRMLRRSGASRECQRTASSSMGPMS